MASFSHLLTQTVYVAPYIGRTRRGDPLFGPQRRVKARVEWADVKVQRVDGSTRDARMRFVTDEPVKLTDRFWLPEDDRSDPDQSHEALQVRSADTPGLDSRMWEVLV